MKTLIKIYRKASAYKIYIIVAAVATIFTTAVNLVAPKIAQEMIKILEQNNGGAADYSDPLNALTIIALSLLGAYILRAVAQFFQSYIGHLAAWKYVSYMRTEIYNHLQKLSAGFYSGKKTGELMSRVTADTAGLETLIAHAVPELISGGLLFVGISVMLFSLNSTLALLTFIPVPLILFAAPLFKKSRRRHKEAQIHMGELNAALQDNFSGIREIQLWNNEVSESRKIADYSERHAKSLIFALLYSAILRPSIEFLTSTGNVIVVGVGGYLALTSNAMTVDEIVAFLLYLSIFYAPVASVTRIVEDMQAGIAGGERIFEILEIEPDVADLPNAKDAGVLNGEIEFRGVWFKYADEIDKEENYTLRNVSFKVPAKQTYAIIGQTGVGKTTLAGLLPRFYDVSKGEILIDNIPIKDMTLSSLRSNIGMVLQDTFLWGGTLRENICYGNAEATNEEMISAAKTACIHEFIESLPLGYETVVGERGIRLSGGQKQRVSIARSLLCDTPALILDEATSSVDTETEREIQNAIGKIAGSKTMLVIAHRLSTVKRADCIIVLKDGAVAEMGNHYELLEKNGVYKSLIEAQSMGD